MERQPYLRCTSTEHKKHNFYALQKNQFNHARIIICICIFYATNNIVTANHIIKKFIGELLQFIFCSAVQLMLDCFPGESQKSTSSVCEGFMFWNEIYVQKKAFHDETENG